MAARPLRVGLVWHSLSSANLGVDALTSASIAILRETATELDLVVEPIVIGMAEPAALTVRHRDVGYFPVRRSTLVTSSAFWDMTGQLDCAVDIGAGDSFADIYGFKRFAFLWLTKVLLARRGVPLLLAPQTIGPFASVLAQRLAAYALNRCTAVIGRDRESVALVRAIAPLARVEQGVDVAFELPFDDRSSERGGARLRIGINVSGLLAQQARSGTNRFELTYDYLAAMEQLVACLSADEGNEILVFTHVAGNRNSGDDDGWAVDHIAALNPRARRVDDFADATAAKSFISSLDFVIAARMHACIAALSAGVPVAPMAYSRKFAGLFGGLGYDAVIPAQGLDERGVVDLATRLVQNREALQSQVAEAQDRARQRTRVYRRAVCDLLLQAEARA